MPLQVIVPKSLEEKDGWPALRSAILESFSAPAQETGASSLEMENPTHLESFNLATPSKQCPPPPPAPPSPKNKPPNQTPSITPQPGSSSVPNRATYPKHQHSIPNTLSLWGSDNDSAEEITSHHNKTELDLPVSSARASVASSQWTQVEHDQPRVPPKRLALTEENLSFINQHTASAVEIEGTQTSMTLPTTSMLTSSYEVVAEQRPVNNELSEIEIDIIVSLGQSEHFREASYHGMLVNRFGCTPGYATLLTRMAMANRRAHGSRA